MKTCNSRCRRSVRVAVGQHGWIHLAKRACVRPRPTIQVSPILSRRVRWWCCWNGAEMVRGKRRMKRRYNMPFGAECRDDGNVRFRLWAPAGRKVETIIVGENASFALAMNQRDHGWFECLTDKVVPGTRYRFRIDGGQQVPDPASRSQPQDVHGPSEVVDPTLFN